MDQKTGILLIVIIIGGALFLQYSDYFTPDVGALIQNDKIGIEIQVNYADGSSRVVKSPWFQHFSPLAVLEGDKEVFNFIGGLLIYAEFPEAQQIEFTGRIEVLLDQTSRSITDIDQMIPMQSGSGYALRFATVTANEIETWTSNQSGEYDLTFIAVENPYLTITFSETNVERIFYESTYVTLTVAVTTNGTTIQPPPVVPPEPDPTPDPTPPPGPEPIFTDGFESGSFTAWGSTSPYGGATASVTDTRSQAGSYSANIQISASPSGDPAWAGYWLNYPFTTTPTVVYFRAYFYLETTSMPDNSRFYILHAEQITDFQNILKVGVDKTTGSPNLIASARDGTGWTSGRGGFMVPTNTWFSVEAHVTVGTSGSYTVYFQGNQDISITGVDTTAFIINRVRFGGELPGSATHTGNSQLSVNLFIDQCEVDESHIGL